MRMQIVTWLTVIFLITILAPAIWAQQWAIKADYTESCSCAVPCPCVFNSAPTLGHCEGNGLIEIIEGHYEGVRLDGISVVMPFRFGEWARLYVSEKATDEQVKAAGKLIEKTFGMYFPSNEFSVSDEPVHVAIERSQEKVKFSIPVSAVELEMVKGLEGKPIIIQNLPAPHMLDYTQYKSVINSYKGMNKEFSYSGTNGLTSRIEASSEK